MATANQTARDKFLEARKAGVDAVTARKQAYGEIVPAQAGGVVQASAPVANPPVTPPTSPAQTMQGVNGETFQIAPTNAQGISTPTQPTTPSAPTPTPAPVTVPAPTPTPTTPTAPVDETTTIKAQNEAQMALNKQKSDLAIQERKQAEADAKLASTPTDQKGVLNALVSGATVPTQNTAAYRNAQTQYKNYQKFSTMTPSQLVSNMKMGEIDTATSQLLANNPSYIQAKQEFEKFQKNQSINKMVQSVANGATGKVQEVDHGQDASDALAKKLGINETNADAYARIVSKNPEVVQFTQTVSSITKQLNTLNTERNAVYADLKKQYPDMSPSAIMTLMSSRTKQATDEIDALNSSLSLTTADLKTAMEMAKGEYEATSADITLQSDIAKEQRQMDNALALNQAEYDQKIAQQAQAMGTPELAIPSVIEQYASQGIFAQKSAQQHIADAKALIAKGGTLGEYISQMQKDFQAKDSYKAKFAPKATENFELKEVGGKTYRFNQATGQYDVISPITAGSGGDLRYLADQFPNQAWAKNNNPAGITWNANFDKGTGTAKLLADAGIQFSKGTARPANEGGNYVTFPTIEDGLKAQQIIMSQTYGNSTVGQMLASWVGTGEGENYAKQVAGMAGVDPNVKVSSLTPEQLSTLQMAKIKKESPGLYGLLSQGTGTQGAGTFTATEEAWANNIMNGKAKISDITTKDNVDKGKVLQLMNQKTGGTTGTMQTNIQTGLEVVNSLINHPGFTDVVGLPSIFANPLGYSLPGTSARDFKAELKRMEAIGFLNMIPQMQGMGALSNSEGLKLAAAYSKLSDTGIGETEYKAELTRLKEGMEKALENMGATIPEPVQNTPQQTVGGEVDYSKYE